jgi:hypothetical protein
MQEQDVRSYCMNLTKRKDTGILKITQQIALSGRLALEKVVDLSQNRLSNRLGYPKLLFQPR